MSGDEKAGDDQRSGLERLLSVFTEVRAGEGVTALLLTLNIFLLLTAYYIIKPVRGALIVAMPNGPEYKSYMSAVIAVLLLFAVPAYASFAKKLPRNRLIVGVLLFFISNLVLFYIGTKVPIIEKYLGLVFFAWVGIFNMMVVAQFWAFANDLYKEEQGKRLFAMIGIGATVGGAIGAGLAALLIAPLGLYQMLLVTAGILGGSALLTQIVHVRETRRKRAEGTAEDAAEEPKKPERPKKEPAKQGAFQMVGQYRYLTLLAAFSLLFTLVNTNGEYILDVIVGEAADAGVADGTIEAAKKKDWIGTFFSQFFFIVNILAVLIQSFLVSRIVKFGGLKLAFFVFPAIAFLDAAALAVLPILLVVRIGKTLENATDYSVNNTVRNMLWLPTTKKMKYQAKQAVDTFFVRMGDVSSAVLVFVMAGLLTLPVRYFAIANIVIIFVLLYVCRETLKEEEVVRGMKERGELPEDDEPEEAKA